MYAYSLFSALGSAALPKGPAAQSAQLLLSWQPLSQQQRLPPSRTVLRLTSLETEGQQPLHSAAAAGDVGQVQQLLASGASIDLRDAQGRTALGLAVYYGRVEAARLLLSSGADPLVAGNNGDTVLALAALAGNVEILGMLLVRRRSWALLALPHVPRFHVSIFCAVLSHVLLRPKLLGIRSLVAQLGRDDSCPGGAATEGMKVPPVCVCAGCRSPAQQHRGAWPLTAPCSGMLRRPSSGSSAALCGSQPYCCGQWRAIRWRHPAVSSKQF